MGGHLILHSILLHFTVWPRNHEANSKKTHTAQAEKIAFGLKSSYEIILSTHLQFYYNHNHHHHNYNKH